MSKLNTNQNLNFPGSKHSAVTSLFSSIEEQKQKAYNSANSLRIPLSKIRFREINEYTNSGVSLLAESLEKVGLLYPIYVKHNKIDDTYILIAGERRTRAAMFLLDKYENLYNSATTEDDKDKYRALIAKFSYLDAKVFNDDYLSDEIEEAIYHESNGLARNNKLKDVMVYIDYYYKKAKIDKSIPNKANYLFEILTTELQLTNFKLGTIKKMIIVLDSNNQELIQSMVNEEISVVKAYDLLTQEKQQKKEVDIFALSGITYKKNIKKYENNVLTIVNEYQKDKLLNKNYDEDFENELINFCSSILEKFDYVITKNKDYSNE